MTADAGKVPEIAAIQRADGLPVHDKEFALADDAAALPFRERPAATIAISCLAHFDPIYRDRDPAPADGLPGKRQHTFEHRHPGGQIAVQIEKARKWFGWLNGNELGDKQFVRRLQT